VLSIESLTPDEATIIALEGSSCTATVMATYTGGAFWQSYPDRLAGELYFDPATPAIVNVRGTAIAGPCSAMDQVVETSTGLVALCTEGLFVYSNATTTWALLSAVPALVVSVDSQTGTLFAGIRDVPGCPGIGLRSYGLQQAPDDGIDVSCLNVNMPSAVGLSASGGATWFWDGHSLSKSLDGARSWVDAS
jgi:hypothetical protein